MKTITFYSYKGGVGRTLALVNMAKRLAEFGKSVCLLDFDLEAPGLIHKYHNQMIGRVKQGLVDYIYEFAINDILPHSISEYSIQIWGKYDEEGLGKITLIPAGNSEKGDYWGKLSRINWWKLFYENDSEGIPFFLDLKEKIKTEINPDYLLIDTRTGVTEVSSITMSLLADSVAIFAANNRENICGSQRIIETITKEENNILGNNPQIHFTLSRIPLQTTPEGKTREYEIIKNTESIIKKSFAKSGKDLKSFNVVHSDRDLELNERISIGYDFEKEITSSSNTSSISLEYLSLFNSLMGDDFSPDEVEKFNKIKHIDKLFDRAYMVVNNDYDTLFEITEEILKLDPNRSKAYTLRGFTFLRRDLFEKALPYLDKAIELGDNDGKALFFRGSAYAALHKYKEALSDFDEYIKNKYREYYFEASTYILFSKLRLNYDKKELLTEVNRLVKSQPVNTELLNLRSNIYRDIKEYSNALEDVYKAIELNESNHVYYATLAEIKLCQDDYLDFYRNFDLALQKGYKAKAIFDEDNDQFEIYQRVFEDSKFRVLLKKHDQLEALDLIDNWLENQKQKI